VTGMVHNSRPTSPYYPQLPSKLQDASARARSGPLRPFAASNEWFKFLSVRFL